MVEGKEKKVWAEADFGRLYRHLCIALQLKRCLPCKHYSACTIMLLSKVFFRKVLVKDACPEKFSQYLIIKGCVITKVTKVGPLNNEWVCNYGLVPNNV